MSLTGFQRRRRELAAKQAIEEAAQQAIKAESREATEKPKRRKKGEDDDVGD